MTSKIVEVLQENSRLLSENEELRELLIESRSWWSPDKESTKVVNLDNVSGETVKAAIDAARGSP